MQLVEERLEAKRVGLAVRVVDLKKARGMKMVILR